MIAHAAETGHRDDPGARQRGDVESIARVVLEIVEIDEAGLAEIVVGELEVPDLRRDDRLGAGRERGVADSQRLVVGKVAGLAFLAECVAAQVQGQDEVGLLDHLLAVQVEVGKVQEQRVLLGRGVHEVPGLVSGKRFGLGMDAQCFVVGDEYGVGGVAPGGRLLQVDVELRGAIPVAFGGVGRQPQISLCH